MNSHTASQTGTTRRPVSKRWRAVALPVEHGGWGFISEAVLLGLLLAPTLGGLALGVAAFGAFLLRQPLKLFIKDVRRGRTVPRTGLARRFALIYGSVTASAGLVAIILAPDSRVIWPLVGAGPLLALQFRDDVRSRSRSLTAELAGASATGAITAAMVLMQHSSLGLAGGVWLALGLKALTAVGYVRSRLRLERNQPAMRPLVLGLHGVAWLLLVASTLAGWTPWTAPLALGLLVGRAVWGLSPWRTPQPPKHIGLREVGYGLAFVLILAVGYSWP